MKPGGTRMGVCFLQTSMDVQWLPFNPQFLKRNVKSKNRVINKLYLKGVKELIENAIEALLNAGIKKLVMVVGYKSEVLKSFLSGKYPEMTIEFIDNPVYNTTNNIYSLYQEFLSK